MRVALIGLGNMGSGIATNVLKAGFNLTMWNRTASKLAPLVEHGAVAAASPRDAAADADVIVTSLMDDRSVRETLNGGQGVLAGMKPGAVHVCVTTISPAFADELGEIHRKHGTRFVFCPVLGRPDAAAEGRLIGLVAGAADAVDAVTPVLKAFTMMLNPVGEIPGRAAMLKLCINYSLASTIEMMGEVYACAEKAGLDQQQISRALQMLFASPVLPMYSEKIRTRDFGDGGFRMSGGLKDVQLMLAAAESVGAHFDIGRIIEDKMRAGIEKGLQDSDWSATYEVTRERAGL